MIAEATFDPAAFGYRFTLRYRPAASRQLRGVVILAPAFAEEMNRCRRMAALAARCLAGKGFEVVARDLHGCGDSSGDFSDAGWNDWIADLAELVAQAPGDRPVWLWGIRAGALFLPDLLTVRPDANLLLWHPVVSGKTAMNQFFRLRAAAAAIGGGSRIDVKSLRAQLDAGQAVEVAGYAVSPRLASGMDAAELRLKEGFTGRVAWLEVSPSEPATLMPAGEALRSRWRDAGVTIDAHAVAGMQFWQTQETAECPALIDATLARLEQR